MSTIQKCQLVDFDNNVIEEVRRAETAENSFKSLLDSTKEGAYDNIFNSFIFKFFVGFIIVYVLMRVMKMFESILIKKEDSVNSGGI